MIILAYFFLMRPGEYCYTSTTTEAHPFRFQDIELFLGTTFLPLLTSTPSQLMAATYIRLTFATQKNANRGEKIGMSTNNHHFFCPCKAAARRILYLRDHTTDMNLPLHTYFHPATGAWPITSLHITTILRASAASIGAQHGIKPDDIDARSLRASGAMALLCSKVDSNLIQLVGRWRSDAMLQYLHVQAVPLVNSLSTKMMEGGNFSLDNLPSSTPP
jgi:hypothetical protein